MPDIQRVYADWETRWLLSNPKPTIDLRDAFLSVLMYVVTAGAIVLSGSRTGSVVASIGALADFASKIGVSPVAASGVEAILAFLTFDAGLLLAGYVLGDGKASERWYVVLLVTAALPSVAANVSPSFSLLGLGMTAAIIVDVIVGVCTPAMAFVAGRVIGATNNARKKKMSALIEAWQAHKNTAWTHSREYRSWNKKDTVVVDRPLSISVITPEQPDRSARIIETLRQHSGSMNVSDLARVLGDTNVNVLADVMQMKDVVRSGSSITLPEESDF